MTYQSLKEDNPLRTHEDPDKLHRYYLRALRAKSGICFDTGKTPQSLILIEQAVDFADKHFGSTGQEKIEVMLDKAHILMNTGRVYADVVNSLMVEEEG